MGWLWTCLGGGAGIQSSKGSKSHRGKSSNQPHDLRLHALPTQLPRHGYGVFEPSHLQEIPIRGKCGEPDGMDAFKIPTTSVNTCISINTLKKASERSLESSFRREFGLSMRSDMDELKEELAALRRRLANEEAEAKKLREEVNYLRSCGVLQRSDTSSEERISQSLTKKDFPRHAYVESNEAPDKQRLSDVAPVKQLRKCFSGPMLFDVHSPSRKEPSESAMVPYSSPTRILSHRAGLSQKPYLFAHQAQLGEGDATQQTGHNKLGEEGVFAADSIPKLASKDSLSNTLQHYPSAKVAAWTSQMTGEGMSKDLVVLDSMDMHWIEVANAPCASGFSTNVRRDDHHAQDHAESPRRPLDRPASDTSGSNSQKLIGKRRQSKRSVDLQELPTEKRSKEQALVLSNQAQSLTSSQIEEQLSRAVAAFRQQKLDLEAKHQASFCQGPSALPTSSIQPRISNPGVVGLFRGSRKKSHAMRNRGFQRALSPVKEAQSIEEITWSRQSSIRNEATNAGKPEDSSNPPDSSSSRIFNTVSSGPSNQGFQFSAQILELSPTKCPKPEVVTTSEVELDERASAMENIAMVPILCASPSLTPKRKSSSTAVDALCALAVNPKTPAESRYVVDDSVEGPLQVADWSQAGNWDDSVEGMDMKPIECASPSFSDRRKSSSSRPGPARQAISFDMKDSSCSSSMMASSNEFLDEVFCTKPGAKSTPSPSGKTPSRTSFRSPGLSVTPSPRKHWTPSPQKDMDSSPLINERSWYCDAIDAIQSINDIRSSKERRLLTESVSLGNSPAGKSTQRQAGPRNPHAFSAEKKILRRAFSWYVAEHDERMRTVGLKERPFPLNEEPEQLINENDAAAQKPFVSNKGQFRELLQSGRQQPNINFKRGVLHARRFSDSDSGGSATFSIDLTRPDCSQNDSLQNQNLDCGDLDARDTNTSASFLGERVDKENSAAIIASQTLSKNSTLRTSDQSLSSTDSNKYLRRSQEAIPENRSVLGSVPFNHWAKSQTDHMYNEDTGGELHSSITQRAGTKPSPRGVPARLLMRSRSFM